MRSESELSAHQRRLLAFSRAHGTAAVVCLITAASLLLSVSATCATFLFGPTDNEAVITSLIIAIVVPLIVAPLASSLVVSLLHALATAYDEVHLLATTDSLTGLANRRRFFGDAERLLAASGSGSLTMAGMVDIDDFKVLNDRLGHATGDAALAMLAARLRHAVGGYGVAGRLGGDEFGLFLVVPDAHIDVVTDALHAACAPFEIQPGQRVAASLGLRSVDRTGTIDAAMLLADQALYSMKVGRRPSSRLRATGTHS